METMPVSRYARTRITARTGMATMATVTLTLTRQPRLQSAPGDNPKDAALADDVILDVSLFESGGDGSLAYAVAADFAHNTGARFIGDPAALSDEALLRRPEHMLSSALK